ncbi:hypothetical protein BGZ79_000605 [Entomortierella chlamydospora]|nr:hypothetical protein BGZ79_000605 [Entomortierella chlamydospora]
MLVALIATMAMAAPANTTATHKPHHTPSVHHKKASHPKATPHHKKGHHATTTSAVHHKTTHKSKSHTTKVVTTKPVAPTPIPSATPKPKKMGQTGTILSKSDFCIFLPPKFGGDIALNEDRAVAFCTKPNMVGAPNAQVLPAGFIKTAHFVANTTANWVQVTGRLNRAKYGLSPKDGGGQYDMRAPVGALCNGYKSFIQLTEPDAEIYCIRCCQNKADCPVNKSTHGCERVLGGSYL